MKLKLVVMALCLGLVVPLIRMRTGSDPKQLRNGAIQLRASLADMTQGLQVLEHRATRLDVTPPIQDHRLMLTGYAEPEPVRASGDSGPVLIDPGLMRNSMPPTLPEDPHVKHLIEALR